MKHNYRTTNNWKQNCILCGKRGKRCPVRPPGVWSRLGVCDVWEKRKCCGKKK